MMPGIDGLEVTRRLRADPSTARMPILLYSAVVGEEIRAQARAAGADEFLGKTLHHAELVALVRDWMASRALPGGIGRSRLVEVALDLVEMLEVELIWLLGLGDQSLHHLAIASERGEQQARRFLQIVGRGPFPVDGGTPFAQAFDSRQPSSHWALESLRDSNGAAQLAAGVETLGLVGLEFAVLNSPGGQRGLLVIASPATIAIDRKRASAMAVAIRYAGVALSQWGGLPSAMPSGDPVEG
jgi:CheY-like chemotaxis protein